MCLFWERLYWNSLNIDNIVIWRSCKQFYPVDKYLSQKSVKKGVGVRAVANHSNKLLQKMKMKTFFFLIRNNALSWSRKNIVN